MILGCLVLLCSGSMTVRAVTWSGSATDVVDEDLVITADSILTSTTNNYVRITANTTDVVVTLSQDVVITASDLVPTLFLETSQDYNIIFDVTHNLRFQGAGSPSITPMFIAVRGGGHVVFNIDGGKSITFGKNGTGGSVKFYVIQDGTVVEINRTSIAPEANIVLGVEEGSLIGYASDHGVGTSTDDLGVISFNPTNTGIGRMLLQLADKAAVVISGRHINNHSGDSYDLKLSDIDTTTPAGCQAKFNIANTDPNAGASLLVANANQTLYTYQVLHPATTTMYGFILSCNGRIVIDSGSYLDYVGLALDKCFTGTVHNAPCSLDYASNLCPACDDSDTSTCSLPVEQVFKKRNPSALIIDGCQTGSTVAACIDMDDESALVLRSGVDCEGVVTTSTEYPFTIDPNKRTPGAGNMVMDVEGCLTVAGSGPNQYLHPTKIEVLSLYVTPTGATVLIDGSASPKNFPARTFAKDAHGALRRYNSGYIFVNNNMVLCDTFLVHTDQNHKIYCNDDVRSEPTYVGGEAYRLNGASRPRIIFSNSTCMIHTSLASSGVDFSVPNALSCCLPCNQYSSTCLINADSCDNVSKLIFYYNGYAMDNGSGRCMILGTLPGSFACDCRNIINADSHLDIMQLEDQACSCDARHELVMTVAPNNGTIIQGVPDDIDGQYSVNSIYLGQSSNISIGSPEGSVPSYPSCPTLTLDGSYFSFGSRGGPCSYPQMSNLTGQGGVFVDNNGTIRAVNTCGVNMGVMVTKSGNGVIDLPTPIARYGCKMGEADWKLDLASTPTIVASGTVLASYILNWNTCCKDSKFLPFECDCTACPSSPATRPNTTGLPVILGEVDQLLVYGSRIGDVAHIKVGKGGNVRELIFPDCCKAGFAPTAVVVLEEGGRVGLGSAHTDTDSLKSSIVLGNNGITLIANGNGCVSLNEDVVINNACHIVQGPDFASGNRLLIASECCRTIRVKSTGVLDLSSFSAGKVELSGFVRLVLEPGATVVMGNVELKFSGHAGIFCEPVRPDLLPTAVPTDLTALDDFRVKFIGGKGTIRFTGCSYFTINENAFAGVETSSECNLLTNLTFILEDSARWTLGYCNRYGGAFQVGNTDFQYEHSVDFALIINGRDAEFAIGQEAFVGFGAVVASKLPDSVPNEWYIGQAYNVGSITISVKNGAFTHNVIWDGNRSLQEFYLVGSVLAIGSMGTYALDFIGDPNRLLANLSRATIRGGGNVVLVDNAAPTRLAIGSENTGTVGILASGPIFKVNTETFSGSGTGLFNFWRYASVDGTVQQLNGRVDIGPFVHNELMAGYVDRGRIQRSVQIEIVGSAGATTDQAHSINIGAAGVRLAPSKNAPRSVQDIRILA
jgi:hypothetical protein